MNKTAAGYSLVIVSGILFGLTPIFSKVLYGQGMNVLSLLAQRNIITIVLLFFLIHFYLRESLLVSWADLKRLFVIALFANLLTSILLQASYLYIPTGMSTTLHFIYPVVTVVEGALFFREKIGKVKWLCVAGCTLGIILFYTPGGSISPVGVVLALCSGITFGTYMVLLNHIGLGKMHSFKILFYNSVFGLLIYGGYAAAAGHLHIPMTAVTLGVGAISTVLASVMACSFLQFGIRIIGAQRSAILSTCEPLTSILLGIAIYHDQISIKILMGIILILTSVVGLTLFDRDRGKKPDGLSRCEVKNCACKEEL